MSLSSRLNHLLEKKYIDKQSLMIESKVTEKTINNYFKGNTFPGESFFSALRKLFPEINLNWLVYGDGEIKLVRLYNTRDDEGFEKIEEESEKYLPNDNDFRKEISFLRDQLKQKDKMLIWMQSQIDRLSTGKQVGMSETGT